MADPSSLLEQARVLSGGALAMTVTRCLSTPAFNAYSELLELLNVQGLPADSQHLCKLLELLAYGTLTDYRSNEALFGPIPDVVLERLKQVSVVQCALSSRKLEYDALRRDLELGTDAEVEALLMQAMYSGMVTGKMDQRGRSFEVTSAVGRDVRPANLEAIISRLRTWRGAITAAQDAATAQMADVSKKLRMDRTLEVVFDKRVEDEVQQQAGGAFGFGHTASGGGVGGGRPPVDHSDEEDGEGGAAEFEDGMDEDGVAGRGARSGGRSSGARVVKRRTGGGAASGLVTGKMA